MILNDDQEVTDVMTTFALSPLFCNITYTDDVVIVCTMYTQQIGGHFS